MMQGREGLLLVGHGSQSANSETEMRALAELVAGQLPDVIVDVGFLEMTDPSAGVVLDGLVARGCHRIVVLPLVLLGAGHAKNDVAAVVLEGRQRHPTCQLLFGSPLGVARDLVAAMGDAVHIEWGSGVATAPRGSGHLRSRRQRRRGQGRPAGGRMERCTLRAHRLHRGDRPNRRRCTGDVRPGRL